MTTNTQGSPFDWRQRALSLERRWIVTAAIVAIVLGLFILFRPGSGLVTVAITFGIYLIVLGASRFALAVTGSDLTTGWRWLNGILGVIVAAAGISCLVNLARSLVVLGFTLGIGLLVSGIAELAEGDSAKVGRPTWLRITSGVVSIIAGIIMLIVPFVSVGLIVLLGGIVLIGVGIGALVSLPRTPDDDAYTADDAAPVAPTAP
jgi:uncharacterized membrane protein HdeD (DUF308 family)